MWLFGALFFSDFLILGLLWIVTPSRIQPPKYTGKRNGIHKGTGPGLKPLNPGHEYTCYGALNHTLSPGR